MNTNFKDEAFVAMTERTIRRLWILCIILILLLAGTNGAWIYYESQYEDVVTTNEIETDAGEGGNASAIMGDGNEVNYGEGKNNTNN